MKIDYVGPRRSETICKRKRIGNSNQPSSKKVQFPSDSALDCTALVSVGRLVDVCFFNLVFCNVLSARCI